MYCNYRAVFEDRFKLLNRQGLNALQAKVSAQIISFLIVKTISFDISFNLKDGESGAKAANLHLQSAERESRVLARTDLPSALHF
jgi:hypothetical protein